MTTLVFLLEEPSTQAMLEGILPQLLPDEVVPEFLVFEGKQDLDKRLEPGLFTKPFPEGVAYRR